MDSMRLWAEVYAPRWQQMQAREEALREQAFVDWTATVLGEPLRQMTLRDMFLLHGAGSPYIAGGAYPEPCDVLQFLWLLHEENRGSRLRRWWHRKKMIERVTRRELAEDAMEAASREVNAYLDDVFQDSPKGSKARGKPLGVCFVASLLVRLSTTLGPCDPATAAPWFASPLARIFQYIKAITRNELGNDFKDYSPSDKLLSDWLAHSARLSTQPN